MGGHHSNPRSVSKDFACACVGVSCPCCSQVLGREFEEMCAQMYYRGKMFGFVHLYSGQEAVSSGVCEGGGRKGGGRGRVQHGALQEDEVRRTTLQDMRRAAGPGCSGSDSQSDAESSMTSETWWSMPVLTASCAAAAASVALRCCRCDQGAAP